MHQICCPCFNRLMLDVVFLAPNMIIAQMSNVLHASMRVAAP